jgi:hypothetical protein
MRGDDQKIVRQSGVTASKILYVAAMNIRSLALRALTSLPIALLATLAFSASAGAATNEIEGVWSFNGGSVAIQPLSNGTFQGTVVTPTKFASCEHPAEQLMWTNMTPQADGSFWGLHQWYKGEGSTCEEDPVPGPTAWRVLHESNGAPYLLVCFSHPGTSQPKIAPDGTATEDTFGCEKSTPLASPSEVEVSGKGGPSGSGGSGAITFNKTVVLPTTTACVSQSSLKIKLEDPKYDPLEQILVKIAGKQAADVKGVKALAKALKKGITLTNLPSGTYKVNVTATTVLKQQLTGSQTYKACTTGSGNIKLKKTHHG